ncbi:MAG TPA: type II toxin-antitoxin system VapC family toxin [Candidatus Sulfotelmatobacter sp.]|jgi:predicted nucleic acid-binding protein
MDAVLLDTDVFSYLMKSNDTRAEAYRPHVRGKTVAISFITVGELYYGAEKKKWSGKTLRNLQERMKAVVTVPYDAELCRTFGRVKASLPKGLVVATNDLWIASSAIRHGIPLISNNRKHFEKIPALILISETPTKTTPVPTTGNLFKPLDSGTPPATK